MEGERKKEAEVTKKERKPLQIVHWVFEKAISHINSCNLIADS